MIVAQRFPRNEIRAEKRILEACKRKAFADAAQYSYPRGGTPVSGPTIRMAELAARHWGNLNYGIRELSQMPGASEMEAFCHDLETNTRITRTFQVRHLRFRRADKGGPVNLEDPRDIYEMTANLGARRLRSSILAVIPGDVIEKAMAQCDETLKGDTAEPLIDRAKRMVESFEELGVSQEQIEGRLGKNLGAMLETELVNLRKVYRSLKDDMSKPSDWFGVGGGGKTPESSTQDAQEPADGQDSSDQGGSGRRSGKDRDTLVDEAIQKVVADGIMDEAGNPELAEVRSHLSNLRVADKTIMARWRVLREKAQAEAEAPPEPAERQKMSTDELASLAMACQTAGIGVENLAVEMEVPDISHLWRDQVDEALKAIEHLAKELGGE